MLKKVLKTLKENKFAALLVLFGSIVWSSTMVKSGLVYNYGMGFWGPNGHDGIWHIALIKSLARGSLENPVFAGEALKNYHLGYDLLLAVVSRLTGLSPVNLYFQIFPPVLALLIGVLTYKFVLDWKGSKVQGLWATFFVYFGGSFGWIISLFKTGQLGGESIFWSQQGISTLVNPPFAFSLILILTGLILLYRFSKTHSIIYYLFSVLSLGILIQIKAYAGILVISGLFIGGIFEYFRHKKSEIFKVFAGAAVLALILFIPQVVSSQGLIMFQPLWFLETMMGYADRLGWPRFYSAMTNWRLGGVWLKAIPAYLAAFAIFWIGNMGTRIVKEIMVWRWISKFRIIGWLEVIVASVIVIGGIIPMFFLQSGTPWNTIQFFYYSLFFSGILAGTGIGEIIEKSRLNTTIRYSIVVGIVLLTIPTTIGTLRDYLPSRPPAKISNEELAALNFLAQQPSGTVLTYPYDRAKAEEAKNNPPRPLFLYESTAYVSAFSGQKVYLEDTVNLSITGYPWEERIMKVVAFLQSNNNDFVKKFLRENNISYIYWLRGQRASLSEAQIGITKIFENEAVGVYRVD